MTISKPKVKTIASFLCFVKSVTNCVHLINWWNTRNNVFKREKAFRVLVQPPKTKNLCTEGVYLTSGSRYSVRICWTTGEKMTPSLLRILQWKESLMISWQTFSATWKIDDGHLKWWGICGRELDWENWLCIISSSAGIIFFLPCFWKS